MRLIVLLLLVFALSLGTSAQQHGHELQLAETKFALESQIHGLKWGFLNNMDTGAVGLANNGFINLYRSWQARPANSPFVLIWKPVVGFWSSDGMFGVTSGPWYTKTDSGISHPGYFFTIWQRSKLDDPFKFTLDIGISLSQPLNNLATRDAVVKLVKLQQNNADRKMINRNVGASFFSTTNAAVASAQSLHAAIASFANDNSFILVSGYGPLKKSELASASKLQSKYIMKTTGARSLGASSFFEWGTLREPSSASGTANGHFVQVWTLESGKPVLNAALFNFN